MHHGIYSVAHNRYIPACKIHICPHRIGIKFHIFFHNKSLILELLRLWGFKFLNSNRFLPLMIRYCSKKKCIPVKIRKLLKLPTCWMEVIKRRKSRTQNNSFRKSVSLPIWNKLRFYSDCIDQYQRSSSSGELFCDYLLEEKASGRS